MNTREIGTILDELDHDQTVYTSSSKDVLVVSRNEGKFGKPTFYAILAHNRQVFAKSYGNIQPMIRRADQQQVNSLRVSIMAYNIQLSDALQRERRHE